MKEINKLPTLMSDHIILRPINNIDAADMYDYAKRDNVGPRAGWKPHQSIDESKKIIDMMMSEMLTEDNLGVFSIVYKKNMKMIGTVGIHRVSKKKNHAEIGYVLNPDYWGKGIMVEAVKRIITWVFEELDLYRLEVQHYEYNTQSKRVIEKCGFTYEGKFRKRIPLEDGSRCDLFHYSILKDEYDEKSLPWQNK